MPQIVPVIVVIVVVVVCGESGGESGGGDIVLGDEQFENLKVNEGGE